MLNERTLINGLILLAGLILGPYLVSSYLHQDTATVSVFIGICFVLLCFFILKDTLCIWPAVAWYFSGQVRLIPLGFNVMQVFMVVLIVYYATIYIALRQKGVVLGRPGFYLPVLVISLIVLYHDHSFGFNSFGSDVAGSRAAVTMLMASGTYICGIGLNTPSTRFMRAVPWIALVMITISEVPFILSSLFPGLTPFLYYVTDNVNLEAYITAYNNMSGEVRLGGLAALGLTAQIFLVSWFPIQHWWRPHRWFVAALSIGAFILVALGGYRSNLFIFLLVTLCGAWGHGSWKSAFAVIAAAMLAIFAVVSAQNFNLINLPQNVQRSLCFLPGTWDEEVVQSAESSNDFRDSIKNTYIKYEFWKSPWIGNGFTFDPREADWLIANSHQSEEGEAKAFIATKTFHVGWISVYDAVGLIGGVAFVALAVALILVSGRFLVVDVHADDPLLPLKVWLFCGIVSNAVGYFTVFGDVRGTYPAFCAEAVILYQLQKMRRTAQLPAF